MEAETRPQDAEAARTEESLIRRAREGDREAFADLYERFLDRIYRYVYYRVGSRQDAEDLTEQVFLHAWRAIGRYECRGVPFSVWLYRLAHNTIVDYRRTRREAEPLDEHVDVEDDGAGPDEVAAKRAEARELAQALTALSEVERAVVVLRFVEKRNHREVAQIIGKGEVATRSIQSRALSKLARLLRLPEQTCNA